MADPRISRRWSRRLPRLSVRGLTILVSIAGAMLGLAIRGARVQHDAVLAITLAGGTAHYNWEEPKDRSPPYLAALDPHSRPVAPQWLVNFLGVDYFGHVVSLPCRRNTKELKNLWHKWVNSPVSKRCASGPRV